VAVSAFGAAKWTQQEEWQDEPFEPIAPPRTLHIAAAAIGAAARSDGK
jgi:hypothetical protein